MPGSTTAGHDARDGGAPRVHMRCRRARDRLQAHVAKEVLAGYTSVSATTADPRPQDEEGHGDLQGNALNAGCAFQQAWRKAM